MKYVEIKAVEINSMDDDILQDSIIFGVDETITKPEEVPAVLKGNGRNRRKIPERVRDLHP